MNKEPIGKEWPHLTAEKMQGKGKERKGIKRHKNLASFPSNQTNSSTPKTPKLHQRGWNRRTYLVGFHFVAFCRYNSERWRLARRGRIECGVPEGKNWSEPRNVTRRAQLQRASPGKGWELNDLIWDSNWRRRRKRRRKSEREGKHQGCRSHCGLQLRSRSNGTGPQPQPLCTLCG